MMNRQKSSDLQTPSDLKRFIKNLQNSQLNKSTEEYLSHHAINKLFSQGDSDNDIIYEKQLNALKNICFSEFYIIQSDKESFKQYSTRVRENLREDKKFSSFINFFISGEDHAFSLLSKLAEKLDISKKEYHQPDSKSQIYPAFFSVTANSSPILSLPLAVLINFPTWGKTCKNLRY